MGEKFRTFTTSAGTIVLAGRDAKTNEELIRQVEPNEDVFHTEAAGSAFVNIKGDPKKGDTKEAAIFCAKYSRDWKKNKKDILIHKFKGRDIYKERGMKIGTFGLKNFKILTIRKEEIENFSITI